MTLALDALSDRKYGVLICGHGSRNRLAVEEFEGLAQGLKTRLPDLPVEYGFLEFAQPILREGLDRLRTQGVEKVLAIPAMLFAAGHAKNDIPSVLNTYSAETGLEIDYGRELGVDRLMIAAAGARIREALEAADPCPAEKTLLVVVGRILRSGRQLECGQGDANAGGGLWLRMGETVYSGVTFPLVDPGLRHVVKLGFKRIVVFPYFLFSGVLVS